MDFTLFADEYGAKVIADSDGKNIKYTKARNICREEVAQYKENLSNFTGGGLGCIRSNESAGF